MPDLIHILIGAVVLIMVLIMAGYLFFYRKPDLPPGLQTPDNHVIGPAFGTVLKIVREIPGFTTIIIFLSPFDIHYQYCPVNGAITNTIYDRSGRYKIASSPEKSAQNEKQITIFKPKVAAGPIIVRQIAGLIARRIVNYVSPGQTVYASQPLGLIKLGSRVDLLVPVGARILVKPGDYIHGPKTLMATLARM